MEAAANLPAPTARPKRLSRRVYVVDKAFQLKYTLILVGVGTILTGLFGGMVSLAYLDAQSELTARGLLTEQLAQVNVTLLWLSVSTAILMAIAMALCGMLITHRVAGPILVMSRYVGQLAKGRYPPLRPLRKTDELQNFFGIFQQAVESIRLRELEEADQLDQALKTLAAQGGQLKQVTEVLARMRDRKREAASPPASPRG